MFRKRSNEGFEQLACFLSNGTTWPIIQKEYPEIMCNLLDKFYGNQNSVEINEAITDFEELLLDLVHFI